MPLVVIESQHASVWVEPHVGVALALRGTRFGRADAAMATEGRPRRVFVCILAGFVGGREFGVWEMRSEDFILFRWFFGWWEKVLMRMIMCR